jgi:hypothetical protein
MPMADQMALRSCEVKSIILQVRIDCFYVARPKT